MTVIALSHDVIEQSRTVDHAKPYHRKRNAAKSARTDRPGPPLFFRSHRQRRDTEKSLMKVKKQTVDDQGQNHRPPSQLADP